jgi:hypothetical protein
MPDKIERVGVLLSADLRADCDRVRAEQRKKGIKISFSGLVEIALRELSNRRDLSDVLRKHGARARRD